MFHDIFIYIYKYISRLRNLARARFAFHSDDVYVIHVHDEFYKTKVWNRFGSKWNLMNLLNSCCCCCCCCCASVWKTFDKMKKVCFTWNSTNFLTKIKLPHQDCGQLHWYNLSLFFINATLWIKIYTQENTSIQLSNFQRIVLLFFIKKKTIYKTNK